MGVGILFVVLAVSIVGAVFFIIVWPEIREDRRSSWVRGGKTQRPVSAMKPHKCRRPLAIQRWWYYLPVGTKWTCHDCTREWVLTKAFGGKKWVDPSVKEMFPLEEGK